MAAPPPLFRAGPAALVRAVSGSGSVETWCPDFDDASPRGVSDSIAWLRAVWADSAVAEALLHASPVLAAEVEALCTAEEPPARDIRRVGLSVARYLLRAQHRPTPFGLFAGVAAAAFGARPHAKWGEDHTVVCRAGAEWLMEVVDRLEACPDLLLRLPVIANSTLLQRGDRLVVPFHSDGQTEQPRAVEASFALTPPVRVVLAAAGTPVRLGALADRLAAEFPGTGPDRVQDLLADWSGDGC